MIVSLFLLTKEAIAMRYEKVFPKQPFFVLAAKKYYKSVIMKYGIAHFYQFTAEPGVEQAAVAIPDGTVDILFCCDEDYPWANICGTVMHPHEVIHREGLYFGVRFFPGVVPPNCDVQMADLVEKEIPLQDVLIDKDLFYRMIEAKSFEERQKVFLMSYLNFYFAEKKNDGCREIYLHMLDEIVRTAGETSVAAMAEEMVYSERYVNKVFKEAAGIAPKKYCKLIQFQYLLDHLDLSRKDVNFALLSSDVGFYDQSHMIKTFKDYTDYTPQKYVDFMQKEKFTKRLIVVK